MWNRSRSYSMVTLLGLASASLAGCKPGDRSSSSSIESRGSGDSSAMTSGDSSSMTSNAALTDPNIAALLDEANVADSSAGAYALKKATDPEVKAFAKMMMGEHHALRMQGQQVAKRLNLAPQPPANDPLKPAAANEMAALQAAPKGAQFDRTYIEQEVTAHKTVLDLAEKAHDSTQNPELKKLIEQAKPVVEKHLDRAEELQKKLSKPSA